MSTRVHVQENGAATPTLSFIPTQARVLQRQ
jgi:hypothetical protein